MNVYFEAAAVIVTLILLGRLLEARAKGRTSEAIKRLSTPSGQDGARAQDDKTVELPIESVLSGDIVEFVLAICPGGRRSSKARAMSTNHDHGQPIPVSKKHGSEVVAGTVN